MKKIRIRALVLLIAAALAIGLSACGSPGSDDSGVKADQVFDGGGDTTIRILSGSENKELAPVLKAFAEKEHITIAMDYAGSLDIMRTLQADDIQYDAVWSASSLWISAGDEKHRVKHAESISVTPVIFGIKKSLAEELGFVGKSVKVSDILEAIRSGKLKFCMTSATQSNSGCSAYIGFLYALAGSPDVLTEDMLYDETLKTNMIELLSGVDRSSGSSDWLKDMFLKGDFDAMVNYECLIIDANQKLEKQGKETLYAVYPEDGLSLADSPLGYVDQGNEEQEKAFLKLQKYLLSDRVQKKIQHTGRRTGYTQKIDKANRKVFNEDWGIQPDRVLSPFNMPSTEILMEALDLYQTSFRKPSLTIYCLDYSGSMYGKGNEQLEAAMEQVLDQTKAKKNLLQASQDDVSIVIPFDSMPRSVLTAHGNGAEIMKLQRQVEAEEPDGGTNIYRAAQCGFLELKKYDLSKYSTAIILMTDGQSDTVRNFEAEYEANGSGVPIFSIMFGDADSSQLDKIAELTNGRVFDGRKNLIEAFRTVKGYN